MKNFVFCISAFLMAAFVSVNVFGQSSGMPFHFQGYAVDKDGVNVANQNIGVKVTLTSSGTGQQFIETHTAPTDGYGVFVVEVGSVKTAEFKKLNFTTLENDDFSIKVEAEYNQTPIVVVEETMKAVPYAKSAGNGNPVGTVIAFAGAMDKLPAGWLVCDGRKLNTTTNPEYKQLASVLGGTWGTPTATEFYLPDLRARFLRGSEEGQTTASNNANADGNASATLMVGEIQNPALQQHSHSGTTDVSGEHIHAFEDYFYVEGVPGDNAPPGTNYTGDNYRGASGSDTNNKIWYNNKTTRSDGGTPHRGAHSHNLVVGNISGTANTSTHETRPFSAVVVYIIKY